MVDRGLDPQHVGLQDAQRQCARVRHDRRCEVGPDVEEVVLHTQQQFADVEGQATERKRDTLPGIGARAASVSQSSSAGVVAKSPNSE